MILISMPHDSIRKLISFLDLKETTRLDSAASNIAYRSHFLMALRGSRPLLNLSIFRFQTTLNYIMLRGQVVVDLNDARELHSPNTPLHWACLNNHIAIARMLVMEAGADVNRKNICSQTPLHCACVRGYVDIARMLVMEAGADVNIRNNNGQTPLQCACYSFSVDIARILAIEAGADVNVRADNGRTSLHRAQCLACNYVQDDIALMLVVERGADVNIRNNDGKTPLHCACDNGHVHIARMLVVFAGADVKR